MYILCTYYSSYNNWVIGTNSKRKLNPPYKTQVFLGKYTVHSHAVTHYPQFITYRHSLVCNGLLHTTETFSLLSNYCGCDSNSRHLTVSVCHFSAGQ